MAICKPTTLNWDELSHCDFVEVSEKWWVRVVTSTATLGRFHCDDVALKLWFVSWHHSAQRGGCPIFLVLGYGLQLWSQMVVLLLEVSPGERDQQWIGFFNSCFLHCVLIVCCLSWLPYCFAVGCTDAMLNSETHDIPLSNESFPHRWWVCWWQPIDFSGADGTPKIGSILAIDGPRPVPWSQA